MKVETNELCEFGNKERVALSGQQDEKIDLAPEQN